MTSKALAQIELRSGVLDPAHEVAGSIASHYGLTFADLRGKNRTRTVAWPRQHAMYAIRQATDLSLPQIGRMFGGRDHTTVLHGIRAHEGRMQRLSEQKAQQ